jgi:hypothetical protein
MTDTAAPDEITRGRCFIFCTVVQIMECETHLHTNGHDKFLNWRDIKYSG